MQARKKLRMSPETENVVCTCGARLREAGVQTDKHSPSENVTHSMLLELTKEIKALRSEMTTKSEKLISDVATLQVNVKALGEIMENSDVSANVLKGIIDLKESNLSEVEIHSQEMQSEGLVVTKGHDDIVVLPVNLAESQCNLHLEKHMQSEVRRERSPQRDSQTTTMKETPRSECKNVSAINLNLNKNTRFWVMDDLSKRCQSGPVMEIGCPQDITGIPENAELRIDKRVVDRMKKMACSKGNFAWCIARQIYTTEEMNGKNYYGRRGKMPLSPRRSHAIEHAVEDIYGKSEGNTLIIANSINGGIRNMIRKINLENPEGNWQEATPS